MLKFSKPIKQFIKKNLRNYLSGRLNMEEYEGARRVAFNEYELNNSLKSCNWDPFN